MKSLNIVKIQRQASNQASLPRYHPVINKNKLKAILLTKNEKENIIPRVTFQDVNQNEKITIIKKDSFENNLNKKGSAIKTIISSETINFNNNVNNAQQSSSENIEKKDNNQRLSTNESCISENSHSFQQQDNTVKNITNSSKNSNATLIKDIKRKVIGSNLSKSSYLILPRSKLSDQNSNTSLTISIELDGKQFENQNPNFNFGAEIQSILNDSIISIQYQNEIDQDDENSFFVKQKYTEEVKQQDLYSQKKMDRQINEQKYSQKEKTRISTSSQQPVQKIKSLRHYCLRVNQLKQIINQLKQQNELIRKETIENIVKFNAKQIYNLYGKNKALKIISELYQAISKMSINEE